MNEITTIQDKILQFRDALLFGIEHIKSAADAYVAAIDQDPKCKEMFHEKLADLVPHSAWAGFEAVGRKQMHTKLLYGGGKNGSYIKRLPYSDQKRIFEGDKVELLTSDGSGLMVDALEITKAQAEQVFNGCVIRSLPEQKAYLESKKETVKPQMIAKPYKVQKGKVVINGVEFTKRDLLGMLEEM